MPGGWARLSIPKNRSVLHTQTCSKDGIGTPNLIRSGREGFGFFGQGVNVASLSNKAKPASVFFVCLFCAVTYSYPLVN